MSNPLLPSDDTDHLPKYLQAEDLPEDWHVDYTGVYRSDDDRYIVLINDSFRVELKDTEDDVYRSFQIMNRDALEVRKKALRCMRNPQDVLDSELTRDRP